MNIKTTLKASVAAAALFAVAAPMAPTAEAGIKNGKDDISLTVSGQVNRGVLVSNDGEDINVNHVDNDNSSTRFRFIGVGKVNEAVTITGAMEMQFESNSTSAVTNNQNAATNQGIDLRRGEVIIEHKQFGKIWLGQGWTATEGVSQNDFSGTAVAQYSGGTADTAASLIFREDGSGNALSGTDVGNVITDMDGLGRNDRIRYDTPKFAGFQVAASHVDGGAADVVVKYSGKFAGTKVQTSLGYYNQSSLGSGTDISDGISGSLSALHDSGFNVTFAGGTREYEDSSRSDGVFMYGKVGYKAKLTSMGGTNFGVGVHWAKNTTRDGDEGYSISGAVVQNINKAATELYLAYHYIDGDSGVAGEDLDPLHTVLAGARIKF